MNDLIETDGSEEIPTFYLPPVILDETEPPYQINWLPSELLAELDQSHPSDGDLGEKNGTVDKASLERVCQELFFKNRQFYIFIKISSL